MSSFRDIDLTDKFPAVAYADLLSGEVSEMLKGVRFVDLATHAIFRFYPTYGPSYRSQAKCLSASCTANAGSRATLSSEVV